MFEGGRCVRRRRIRCRGVVRGALLPEGQSEARIDPSGGEQSAKSLKMLERVTATIVKRAIVPESDKIRFALELATLAAVDRLPDNAESTSSAFVEDAADRIVEERAEDGRHRIQHGSNDYGRKVSTSSRRHTQRETS